MIKGIISGGPHSGKTTLLEALGTVFPDAYFVPEPATQVITEEDARQQLLAASGRTYIPRMPWIDYGTFGPLVAAKSVELELAIPAEISGLVLQDRSLIDTIAYARLNNCSHLVPRVQRLITAAEYSFTFFCEPVGEYASNDVRREDAAVARQTHDYLSQAYQESDIEVIDVPAVPLDQRVVMVTDFLQSRGFSPIGTGMQR